MKDDNTSSNHRMWEEYKLLQDKIDKIGDFRFRIKSWAMTLLTGLIIGGFASDIPTVIFLIGLPIIAMFHIFDLNQSIWHDAFVRRLSKIEFILRRESKTDIKGKYFTKHRKSPGVVFSVVETMKQNGKKRLLRWFVIPIHNLFYFVLYIVILGTFLYAFLIKKNETKTFKQNILNSTTINQSSNNNQVENP